MSQAQVLIIVDHNNRQLHANTFRLLSAALRLAPCIIDVFIGGYECSILADEFSQFPQVNKVLVVDSLACEHLLAEDLAPVIAKVADNYTHIMAAASTQGKDLLPRLAGLMDLQPISDVLEILDRNTFKRPIYAGSAIATVASDQSIQLMTIRTSAFAAIAASEIPGAIAIQYLSGPEPQDDSQFIEAKVSVSERPELTAARVVVSGGRALQNAENFAQLYELADLLGGAVGASRAAVDAGFAANDLQVGQTGKIIAPDLYIAVGISGAVQHLAGIKDAKIVVAINNDPDAPIFQQADYSLEADLFEAVPELIKQLREKAKRPL